MNPKQSATARQTKRPLSLLLSLFLATVLTVGCGNSTEEFVFTGTSRVITNVDVQPPTASLTVGQSRQFVLETTFSDGTTVTTTNQFNGQVAWDSDNEAVATIDENGLATGLSPGTATITGTLTSAQGVFFDTATLTVTPAANQSPQVNLDDAALAYTRGSGDTAAFPNATVTDDQANLANGTLTIEATGNNTGIDLPAPNTPDIGTVTDDDANDTITVALNNNATPANIQSFLRAVQFQADNTANFGSVTLDVTLTDGQGGNGTDSRQVNIQGAAAQNVTVAPSGADFTTIQAAVNSVAAQSGGQGSVITVSSGDFTSDGTGTDGIIVISNDADLEGLEIRGANAGVSAGINPGTRGTETVVNAFDIDNQVTIDGFQVNGGGTSVASADDQGFGLNDEASGSIIRNNVVDYTGVNASTRGVLTVTGTDPSNLTIEFNHFQGWTGAVYLQGTLDAALPLRTGGHTINGNVAEMNTVGFSNDAVENTEFTNNVVLSDGAGEEAFGFAQAGTGIVINNNDIANQVVNAYVVLAVPNLTIDAENNWWGQASGPINDGSGDDQINRDGNDNDAVFDTDPFLTTDPFPALP